MVKKVLIKFPAPHFTSGVVDVGNGKAMPTSVINATPATPETPHNHPKPRRKI